jgi:hypothetical protein
MVSRKAKRGRPGLLDNLDLLLAAFWAKYLCLSPSKSVAATLLARREPAIRTLLRKVSPGTLRNRLRKLHDELLDPYWEYLVLVAKWAKEVGLPSRSPDELQGMKWFPTLTPQQFDLAGRYFKAALLLRYRLETSEFESVTRLLFGKGCSADMRQRSLDSRGRSE